MNKVVNEREKMKSEGCGHDAGMTALWMLSYIKHRRHGDVGSKLFGVRQTWVKF